MDDSRNSTCPVCDDAFAEGEHSYNNTLSCPNRHHVCFQCIGKIMKPDLRRRRGCDSGMLFHCPLCRTACAVTPIQLLAMCKGSWRGAFEEFGYSTHEIDVWERNGKRPRPSAPRVIVTRSSSSSSSQASA
tara:strand:- start:20 stop:412 length:393 start_codon:yes stop_codon:yes gene_type:complete